MAGLSSDHNQALARLLGHGRDSCQTAQDGVISPLQGIKAFCKQRGEDNPTDSRQGCEDFRVMQFAFQLNLGGGGKLRDQSIEPVVGLCDLPVQKTNARDQHSDVRAGRFSGASGKAWYLFANPKVISAFEIVFLNGRRTPVIERVEAPPNNLGMGFRGYLDVGVKEQDPRGAVKVKGEV